MKIELPISNLKLKNFKNKTRKSTTSENCGPKTNSTRTSSPWRVTF